MYKRHYLQVLAALLVCFVVLLLVFDYGARRDQVQKREASIEIILKARQNPPDFWRVVEQGVMVASQEFGVRCNVTAPVWESDVEGQIILVEAAIGRGPDAIILVACDYERLVPVCKEAVGRGITLVTMDSDINYDGRKCFVGTDNYDMGRKLALLVDEAVGSTEKFGVMAHTENTTTAVERRSGLLENVLDPEERMVALDYCEGMEEVARDRTKEMLAAHPEIVCMVGLNETSSLGITYAVQDMGLEDKISVIAGDSSQKQIELMEQGVIRAFVVQNPFNMGYLSVQNTVKLLRGEQVSPVVLMESVVIRKEDLYKKENQKLIFPFSNDTYSSGF